MTIIDRGALGDTLRETRHLRGTRVCWTRIGSRSRRRSSRASSRAWRGAPSVDSGVHTLRHTFCSHLAMRGAPARAIQELAGHQDLGTTQRYMHLSPAALEAAIELLEGADQRAAWKNSGGGGNGRKRPVITGRKWWRRRESNPRPKGLSPQESTCVAVLCFAPGLEERRMGRPLVRRVSPHAPDARQSQPAKWRSSPARRLTGGTSRIIRPRAQAACPQLRCFSTGLTSEVALGMHPTVPCPRRSRVAPQRREP